MKGCIIEDKDLEGVDIDKLLSEIDVRQITIKSILNKISIVKIKKSEFEFPETMFYVANPVGIDKNNPPKPGIYTRYKGSDCSVCFGFCAVLVHWAMEEAINRKAFEGEENIYLTAQDFQFSFDSFIPIYDLIEAYVERQKERYKMWISCSPRLAIFAESDDKLCSKIFFDELENINNFFYTIFANQLNENQLEDIKEHHAAFRYYMVKNYHISMPVFMLSEKLVSDLVLEGVLQIPKGMSVREFRKTKGVISLGFDKDEEDANESEYTILHKDNYVELVEWLAKKKDEGRDYYAEAGNNRSKMCRMLTKELGWVVDENSLRKAQERLLK